MKNLIFLVLGSASENWSYMREFRKAHIAVFSPSREPVRSTMLNLCARGIRNSLSITQPPRLSFARQFAAAFEDKPKDRWLDCPIDLTLAEGIDWESLAERHKCTLTRPPGGFKSDDPITAWEIIHCVRPLLRLAEYERAVFYLQNRDPLIQRLGIRFVKALAARS